MNTYLKDDVDDEEDGEEEDRFASSVVTSEISTIIYLVVAHKLRVRCCCRRLK